MLWREKSLPTILLFFCFLLFLLSDQTVAYNENEYSDVISEIRQLQRQLRSRRTYLEERWADQDTPEDLGEWSHEWVAEIHGGESKAKRVANDAGYEFVAGVRGFQDHYLLKKRDLPVRSKREAIHHTKRLADHDDVSWVEQQRVRRRQKRDYLPGEPPVAVDFMFNDPYWPRQWELHDTRQQEGLPKLDLHVLGAWQQGFTGKGVSVSILDDGVQRDHIDLAQNYDALASYDLNDNDTDPTPQFNDYNRHGTRCAGEIAMVANNGICGVGIAHNANIGGIRMLDGRITDRLEAEALQFNIDHVDVFSASWGPNDDGSTVEGPGTLAEKALINGIKNGRQGKGIIYAWASGNGGSNGDDCDCDGYTDSIYTLSISSASQSGNFPWYGEKCASTMATTYSSGAYQDQKITTTDIRDECTTDHTGTSASAPLAAGIVALALEANPELTWRDVQHITVWTSEYAPLIQNDGWHKNGRGLYANTRFGYGLMNADAFVRAAKDWENVPRQRICTTTFPSFTAKDIHPSKPGKIRFLTDACKGQVNEVNFVEHVQVVTDIDYTRRGNLAIVLTSPMNTSTRLLSPRSRDSSTAGFRQWPFMSVHTWGEDPKGWWTLELQDPEGNVHDFGSVKNITLITYGTKEAPAHYAAGRQYDMNYNDKHDRAIREEKIKKLEVAARSIGTELTKRWAEIEKRDLTDLSKKEIKRELHRINRALSLADRTREVYDEYSVEDEQPHVYETFLAR